MLKKMQGRFILAVMSAFFIVMTILVVGINSINRYQMKQEINQKIRRILEYEEMIQNMPQTDRPPIYDMPWARGNEKEFTTRYFMVHCDKDGKIKVFGNDYIFSIDESTAQLYTQEVLKLGRESGDYKEYHYVMTEKGEEVVLVFLNVANEKQFQKNLLTVSVLTEICSLLAVFVLVIVFSNPVMKPYIRNIERQKQFITNASHELKTPITSISTSVDILAMEYEKDEWINNIKEQIIRLSKLVQDLVTLSGLDEEIPYPEKTNFSLSETVWEIIEPFSAMAKVRGKEFSQKIEENLYFYGDKNSIQQMLSLLLDNAIKYSEDKGKIQLNMKEKHGKIIIELKNTCDANGKIEVEHLFERFYRPDSSRSVHTGGSGIGLSIVQGIVHAHGGRISASMVQNEIIFKIIL